MKKLLFLFSFYLWVSIAQAQTNTAQVKFEQAEEAFTGEKYTEALTLLQEAEDILGFINPKIMYLRIMAQYFLIEKEPYKDYELLKELRENCAFFLKENEENTKVQAKYREVFDVLQSLSKYPSDLASFNEMKKRWDENFEKGQAEARRAIKVWEFAKKLGAEHGFKPGLTRSEFLSFNKHIASVALNSVYDGGSYTSYARKTKSIADMFTEGPSSYTVNKESGEVYSYATIIQGGKNDPGKSIAVFEALRKQIIDLNGTRYLTYRGTTSTDQQLLSIAVPYGGNPNKIDYYIQIDRFSYKKWSYVSISFGSTKGMGDRHQGK